MNTVALIAFYGIYSARIHLIDQANMFGTAIVIAIEIDDIANTYWRTAGVPLIVVAKTGD